VKIPLLVRALVIAGVAVLVLLPIGLIEGKINERRSLADSVVAQFAAETSGAQVVAGPLLALTCEETVVEERSIMRSGKEETVSQKKTIACPTTYFAPRTLKVNGNVPVENRRRGIYQIRLYRAALDIAGEFDWPAPAAWNGLSPREWKRAYVVMAVSDTRGIKSVTSTLSPNVIQGRGEGIEEKFALRQELGDYASRQAGSPLAFGYKMELVGTSSLHVAPVGDATEIRLASNWPHPSFGGSWSPDQRQITSQGFDAVWRTSHLSTGGRVAWNTLARAGTLANAGTAAGVALFDPVNVYALSYRATQYAFLFVLFTFSALALTEILADVRLHAMQYALVGSAIAVFFLLLIALSEHIAFAEAYAAAATACVLLLTFYLRHPLGTFLRTATFFAMFVGLYGTLFVLLKSEDHALLMGSLMVFAVLAVAMIATRKLDWGQVGARMQLGSSAQ
jgi:inner membrane protein